MDISFDEGNELAQTAVALTREGRARLPKQGDADTVGEMCFFVGYIILSDS